MKSRTYQLLPGLGSFSFGAEVQSPEDGLGRVVALTGLPTDGWLRLEFDHDAVVFAATLDGRVVADVSFGVGELTWLSDARACASLPESWTSDADLTADFISLDIPVDAAELDALLAELPEISAVVEAALSGSRQDVSASEAVAVGQRCLLLVELEERLIAAGWEVDSLETADLGDPAASIRLGEGLRGADRIVLSGAFSDDEILVTYDADADPSTRANVRPDGESHPFRSCGVDRSAG